MDNSESNDRVAKSKPETFNLKGIGTDFSYKHEIVWPNAIGFLILHILSLWSVGLIVSGRVKLMTVVWTLFYGYLGATGITVGAHRLYTHRSFKATPILRAILVLLQTIAGQNSLFIWCRDHRLHHRYVDTDADPHNSKRGFFFGHIGWLMTKKHPYVIELGRKINLSDLQSDWMVMFQKKYYYFLYIPFAIILPVWVPVTYFGESLLNSILVCYIFRWIFALNGAWLVNSAAHLYGTRPYDKNMQPVESWFVSLISLGEGWHNFHHVYPWDYAAAELSMHFNFNATVIRFCERIGLAYDLKSATSDMVTYRVQRTGDGTHHKLGSQEAKKCVTAIGPKHPLNPSYNVIYPPPNVILNEDGLKLFHEKDTYVEDNTSDNMKDTIGQ